MDTKWDIRFLQLAKLVASWSKDPRTKVGAVLVRPDKTVASIGFNGLPRGIADTFDRLHNRSLKHQMVLHAEENAILFCKDDTTGLTLYTWPIAPCPRCAAKIIQCEIVRVVCPSHNRRKVADMDMKHTVILFEEAGLKFDLYKNIS